MKSSTGRWVSGEDFFDRDRELQILETRVRERNAALSNRSFVKPMGFR